MLVFIILGLILALSIFASIRLDYDEFWDVGIIMAGIITLIAIIILLTELPWKRNVEYDIAKYEELKKEVQQVSMIPENECDLTILVKKDLFEEIREMNNYIDKNKTYNDSWWIGWFYSEEIGNLEKINYYIIE